MPRNPFWLLFLVMIAVGTVGYTSFTAVKIWNYLRLDRQAVPQEMQWSIEMQNDEAFTPKASYHFVVKERTYAGQTLWHESYLNAWTAQEEIGKLSQHPIHVWYDSSSPDYSSLERRFPYKESFSAVSLWIICLYFVCLNYYIRGNLDA